ncbi:MAG: hypothetical protein EFT35_10870 [Methanophagales archaeon ANME-1-THS]|nr:MAG: hypothetical protein EFT35_10870 [Methanophagales archaeon ANME-1-THS]
MHLSNIPEKRPVFRIEDETVKESLMRRGLMGEGYINLSGVEGLIKKGVYTIDSNGTLELIHNIMVSTSSEE